MNYALGFISYVLFATGLILTLAEVTTLFQLSGVILLTLGFLAATFAMTLRL